MVQGERSIAVLSDSWPEFRVRVNEEHQIIELEFGINGPVSELVCWVARMGDSGVVLDLNGSYRYWPEGAPETGNKN